jgi:hypothetical protein
VKNCNSIDPNYPSTGSLGVSKGLYQLYVHIENRYLKNEKEMTKRERRGEEEVEVVGGKNTNSKYSRVERTFFLIRFFYFIYKFCNWGTNDHI